MKISLIITTYNRRDALELCLVSALGQSLQAHEIIIADDGSNDGTGEMLQDFIRRSDKKIIHSFQEDRGFRLSRSRNEAIKKTTGDYIVICDGDMILDRHFLHDHNRFSKPGVYLQGSRVLLNEAITREVMNTKKTDFSFWDARISNRKNMLRIWPITRALSFFPSRSLKGIRGCNFSLFKEDILKINGFNEDFQSWGREDSEFVQRLFFSGVRRINLKFAGVQFHLFHPEGNASSGNEKLLAACIEKGNFWCDNGIVKSENPSGTN